MELLFISVAFLPKAPVNFWLCYFGVQEIRTSIKASLHEHSYGFNTKFKVFWSDMGSIAYDEWKRIHTLDEGFGVMQTHVLPKS